MEINDIPHQDSIVFLDDDMACLRVSTENDEACQKIYNIIYTLFGDDTVIYKFIGFLEDLELHMKHCNNETVRIFKGKTKLKFITSSYPELHAQITDSDSLMEVLHNWSSAIYQTQVLYIVALGNGNNVLSTMEKDLYKDTDSISSNWCNIKIAIRNQPEAEYHNTFLIFTHKVYLESIQKLL